MKHRISNVRREKYSRTLNREILIIVHYSRCIFSGIVTLAFRPSRHFSRFFRVAHWGQLILLCDARKISKSTKYPIGFQHRFSPKSRHSPRVVYPLGALPCEIRSRIDEHDVQFVLPLPVAPVDLDDLLWMPPPFMADDVNHVPRVWRRHGGPMVHGAQAKDHERDQAHPKRATTHITGRYWPRSEPSGLL